MRTVKRWVAQAYQQGEFGIRRTPGGHYRIPQKTARAICEGLWEDGTSEPQEAERAFPG